MASHLISISYMPYDIGIWVICIKTNEQLIVTSQLAGRPNRRPCHHGPPLAILNPCWYMGYDMGIYGKRKVNGRTVDCYLTARR